MRLDVKSQTTNERRFQRRKLLAHDVIDVSLRVLTSHLPISRAVKYENIAKTRISSSSGEQTFTEASTWTNMSQFFFISSRSSQNHVDSPRTRNSGQRLATSFFRLVVSDDVLLVNCRLSCALIFFFFALIDTVALLLSSSADRH